MKRRIDLESAIMQAWATSGLIEDLAATASIPRDYPDEEWTKEDILRSLEAIVEVQETAMQRLFDTFEFYLRNEWIDRTAWVGTNEEKFPERFAKDWYPLHMEDAAKSWSDDTEGNAGGFEQEEDIAEVDMVTRMVQDKLNSLTEEILDEYQTDVDMVIVPAVFVQLYVDKGTSD